MKIETLGHACMCIYDDDGSPIMLTDPWLVGSTYWRSWWLQNYPSAEKMEQLSQVKFAYITHEHMDHFHPPSIRKLGKQPTYLAPALPQEQIAKYLDEKGFNTRVLKPMEWHQIHPKVAVLSIPLPNDDSVLLVNTPKAFIVNLNDSKPMKYQLRRVRKYISEHISQDKKVIMLCSYSPASPVNSFRKDSKVVSMKDKVEYVKRVSELSDQLGADYFMPFASQVIFYRSDSRWANAYKVSVDDLKKNWSAKCQLCHPHTTIDMEDWSTTFIPESSYQRDEEMIASKVAKQEEDEKEVKFGDKDIEKLRKKLSFSWFLLPILFRKGIGFIADDREFTYKPWGRKMVDGIQNPSFSLMVPPQALKDVLYTGHFADLGITMFTLIILNGKINPKMVYLFFLLISMHDYHHLWSFKNFWKWLKTTLRLNRWKLPAPPSTAMG